MAEQKTNLSKSTSMIPIKIETAWRGTSDCKACGIRDMVLFSDLNEQDFSLIHAPIDDLNFPPGRTLYLEGQDSQGVFTLRTGLVKLVRTTAGGDQRIVCVLKPGNVVGIEALASGRYDTEAIALTDVAVCRIPSEVVHRLSQNSPRLHTRLMLKWQESLKEANDWLSSINFGTARQRVSQLILKMRDTDNPELSTLFSREDMGSMTGLKLETVSREISALVRDGALEQVDKAGRRYRVLNASMLG
jgi:CRP/FNR family transcriptional regulator